jgi:hypothetical protein
VPRAVQACHELLAWLIPLLDKFPRSRRFTLGERLEAGLLTLLEALVQAAYTRHKQASLQRANLQLEVQRHLWRLAYELEVTEGPASFAVYPDRVIYGQAKGQTADVV